MKQKPYRVILRCVKKSTLKRVVAELIKQFDGEEELRVSRIHRG